MVATNSSGTGAIKTLATLSLLCGIWMIICPFAVGASAGARVDDVVFGILAVIVGATRLGRPSASGMSWANVVFGIWLLISPFVLGWAGTSIRWNNVVTGILLAIFAGINTRLRPATVHYEMPSQRAA